MPSSQPIPADPHRAFYERRHPFYIEMLAHWVFLRQTYFGGRAWFQSNLFKYLKEGEQEFEDRRNRAYRFNHTREVVELVQKYLFKSEISRNIEAASQAVTDFWNQSTLSGLGIGQLMRQVSTGNSIGGRVAVVVDNNVPTTESGKKLSIKEAKRAGGRIYAYVVQTEDILDYAWDEEGDGGLLWIKLLERFRDDVDPLTSTGLTENRVRLWTRTGWTLYAERESTPGQEGSVMVVREIASGAHNLGVVPVILADHTIGTDPYHVPGLIDDIAYLDRAVANYLSNLDAIIQDQTFSQLAIPAQAIMQGDDIYQKVTELGTKRIFVFDGGAQSNAKPEFISPDPKQASVILTVINKIINEIYHTIGLAGERTKEDNAVGIDNSSGVAKAYDFERVNSLLLSKAQSCEAVENWIVEMVCRWAGETPPSEKLVSYPTTFDVMRLIDDLSIAEALFKINAPAEVRREQMRLVIDKLFPQIKKDLKEKLLSDIEAWLTSADVFNFPPTSFGDSPTQPNRQGQVTRKTTPKTS